ncbi:hypothetical protein Ahy_A09g044700 [Arachis hypogaea]|uniref:Pre-rRNA-processing protein TSR2 homolog n=1 Tax=Arachis hypogaea TaxID=3818 RepID=A0A445BKL6_ARAHY|nr:hypothetical protein Ahy_A09g044700 [Arachis hypogaea]
MEAAKRLQGNSLSLFSEGIGFVLSRWSALRDAVENQWGGPDSRLKADNLATDILSWFTQSREPLDTDDLEDKLYDGMLSLNVVVEDGSIKEVAKNLMVMHEECLEGNFVTIERYRQAIVNQAAHPRAVPQTLFIIAHHGVILVHVLNRTYNCDDEDDDEDEEDDDVQGGQNGESSARQATSNMDVDIPKSESNMSSGNMRIDDEPLKKDAGEAEDGWVVVSKKKKQGAHLLSRTTAGYHAMFGKYPWLLPLPTFLFSPSSSVSVFQHRKSGRRRHRCSVFHLSSCAANRSTPASSSASLPPASVTRVSIRLSALLSGPVSARLSAPTLPPSLVPSRKKRRRMEAAKRLQGNSLSLFSEGIGFVLSRWSALRDAVENQWGGPDSRLKADNLATDILSWFTQSREPLDTDDLEDKLYDGMLSLNVVVEDGSIKEVAKNLMVMHEECLEGNFVTIERYRQAIVNQAAHPRAVPQTLFIIAHHGVILVHVLNRTYNCDDEDDDEDEEDDDVQGGQNGESSARQATSNMDVDIPKSESNMSSGNMRIDDEPLKKDAGEAEDGWVVVSKKKKQG